MNTDHLPEYTIRQLSLKNGQDSSEIWVAYKGLIYDMTQSLKWYKGLHYEHWSGQDLTDELANAPHSDSVFNKFIPIGKVKES